MNDDELTEEPDDVTGKMHMLQLKPCHVGQDVLSQILGITDRRIRQLAGQGILLKAARGHYPFPAVVSQYCDYLRSGGEGGNERLKNRELELKCKRLEQTIAEYDTQRREDVESECWSEVRDILSEYKRELERAAIDEATRGVLNTILAEAVQRVENSRADKKLPVTERQDGSDCLDTEACQSDA